MAENHWKDKAFEKELRDLVDRYTVGDSSTPDFILAVFIHDCLQAFTKGLANTPT